MNRRISLLLAGIVLAVTALVLSPTLRNGFTNLDDDVLVTNNAKITQLTPASVRHIFSSFHEGFYYPMVLLSYAVEFRFFKLAPTAYHSTNLLLHLLNCLLVFWLFKRLSGNAWVSFIVALLFGVHPLQVESVAWVAERKDVLYAAFFLAALVGYDHYLTDDRQRYYYAAIALFICSLLSKSMGVTLPAILILLDFYRKRKLSFMMAADKLPFILISVFFTFLTIASRSADQQQNITAISALVQGATTACFGLLFSLQKLVFPVKLSAIYPDVSLQFPLAYLYPAAVLALGTVFALTLRRSRKPLFGVLFFLILISPVLHFIPDGWNIPADRFTYLPCLGLFYLFAEGSVRLAHRGVFVKRGYRAALISAFVLLIAVFSAESWQRSHVWHDSISLYTDVINKYPGNYYAWHNRGQAYSLLNESDLAFDDYNTTITLNENFGVAYNNRGTIYYERQQYDEAMADYFRCIQLEPYNILPYLNISDIYRDEEEFNDALSYINQAGSIDPDNPLVYCRRAGIYEQQGKPDEAIAEYSAALRLDPYCQDALASRGKLYDDRGAFPEALEDFKKMVEVSPENAESYFHLGNTFAALKNYPAAETCYLKTLSLQSDYPDALIKLNDVHHLRESGDLEKPL